MYIDFPPHSTLTSIAAAAVRDRRAKSINRVIGGYGHDYEPGNYLGEHSASLARRIFGDETQAARLIRQHSHFPVVGGLLSAAGELQRQAQLQEGSAEGLAFARRIRSTCRFEATSARRCMRCVEEDLAQYGIAYWRTFHQWPFARHCLKHLTGLETMSTASGKDTSLALPHDAIGAYGISDFRADKFVDAPVYWPRMRALTAMLLQVGFDGLRPVPNERTLGTLLQAALDCNEGFDAGHHMPDD
jgi:hypothetical protein